MGMCARVLHVAYNDDRDARDDCDAHARDGRYTGLPRGSGAAKAARLVKRAASRLRNSVTRVKMVTVVTCVKRE